jgi:hypothetical protein
VISVGKGLVQRPSRQLSTSGKMCFILPILRYAGRVTSRPLGWPLSGYLGLLLVTTSGRCALIYFAVGICGILPNLGKMKGEQGEIA